MHQKTGDIPNQQIRFITPYNSRSNEMRAALNKHWDLLLIDDTLRKHLPRAPSITNRRPKNVKDLLVTSHHVGTCPNLFPASKGSKWGCNRCDNCVACPNVMQMTKFWDSSKSKKFTIAHTINCNTSFVVYIVMCPCGLIYVGRTSRELKKQVREHVLGIRAAREETDIYKLKPIARQFKLKHNCDPHSLQVWGINRILTNPHGGNMKLLLAQREAK